MVIIVLLLFILIASAVALVLSLNALINIFRDKVPYVSTPKWAIDWLCQHASLLLQGGVARSAGVVYDLGCGDARVLIALKKYFPDITAIGYERNWWPYILAKARIRRTGVKVYRRNFYKADLKNADIVFCFLIHSVMPKVENLLRSQLKPGATVYSYGFTFPNWQPTERIANPNNPKGSKINVYRVTERAKPATLK
ncbi:MAG: hypothetical protein HY420_02775 [Candidatus Kerfeldbacteria bacterium]|nr:hypothetical protein [Candidatus Kerfeldbacteria bacterium]